MAQAFSNPADESNRIERHRTAIRRYKLSKPLALALANGLIDESFEVFDYGCGHGEDVRYLQAAGFRADGWDPHFRRDATIHDADVVNLGYVLNVIENPSERTDTLFRAFELARKLLIVAVRVDQSLDPKTLYGDGVITGRGAFQKIFLQSEFRAYIEGTLGLRLHMAALGVGFVFKDPQLAVRYVSNVAVRQAPSERTNLIALFVKDRIAQRFVNAAVRLGRLPLASEFKSYSKLLERFGSPQRVARLATTVLAQRDIESIRAEKRQNLLLYLAMLRLQGAQLPPLKYLPQAVQADIKAFWPNYKQACLEGEAFLFNLGNPEKVRQACNAARVGKVAGDSLYFHRSYLDSMPPIVRLVVFAATRVVGDVEHDLIKIGLDGRKVSFLRYPDFDSDPHPALEYSVRVHLPTLDHVFRDYRDAENPPILHRKDAMVDELYPGYAEFHSLSRMEESAGLLSRADIGFRRQWQALLAEGRFRLVGHTLHPIDFCLRSSDDPASHSK